MFSAQMIGQALATSMDAKKVSWVMNPRTRKYTTQRTIYVSMPFFVGGGGTFGILSNILQKKLYNI